MGLIGHPTHLFFSIGANGATMPEIDNRAIVAKGTIYGYDINKQDLFISLMEEFSHAIFLPCRRVTSRQPYS
ncbi:helix-turn-helix domain-containing protein [Desulfosarcina ovata]|nr:helix-turn-helix domain-containing protein [Desulfosarcina ovata]